MSWIQKIRGYLVILLVILHWLAFIAMIVTGIWTIAIGFRGKTGWYCVLCAAACYLFYAVQQLLEGGEGEYHGTLIDLFVWVGARAISNVRRDEKPPNDAVQK